MKTRYVALGPILSGEGSRAFLGLRIVDEVANPCALVWAPEQVTSQPELIERLRRDTACAERLDHPNITRVYGLTNLEDGIARVVEFADGESLRRILDVLRQVPPGLAARMVIDAAAGVQYAHLTGLETGAPLVHGDIRPETLLVSYSGVTKVTGYGALSVAPREIGGRRVIGRRKHSAPEQILGGRYAVCPQTDVYLLGATLYESITGKIPFGDEKDFDRAVVTKDPLLLDSKQLPARLWAVIRKAMAKMADLRFQTAEEFAMAVEEAMGSLPSQAELAEFLENAFATDEIRQARRREYEEGIHEWIAREGVTFSETPVESGASDPSPSMALHPDRSPDSGDGVGSGVRAEPHRARSETSPRATDELDVEPVEVAAAAALKTLPSRVPSAATAAEPVPTSGAGVGVASPEASHAPPTLAPPALLDDRVGTPRQPETARAPPQLASPARRQNGASRSEPPTDRIGAEVLERPAPDDAHAAAMARPSSSASEAAPETAPLPAPAPNAPLQDPPRARRPLIPLVLGAALLILALSATGVWLGFRLAQRTSPVDKAPPARPGMTAAPPLDPTTPNRQQSRTERAAPPEEPAPPPATPAGKAKLVITSEPPLNVSVDGQSLGRTPVEIAVSPGAHRAVLSDNARAVRIVRNIQATTGLNRVNVTLGAGTLAVKAPPGSEIRIDGRLVGTAPLPGPAKVFEGKHRIVVTSSDGSANWQQPFTIKRGDELTAEVTFQRR